MSAGLLALFVLYKMETKPKRTKEGEKIRRSENKIETHFFQFRVRKKKKYDHLDCFPFFMYLFPLRRNEIVSTLAVRDRLPVHKYNPPAPVFGNPY